MTAAPTGTAATTGRRKRPAAPDPQRIDTVTVHFERLGPTTAPYPGPVPDLAVTVPPHSGMDPHATAGVLTEAIHRYALMFLPNDIAPTGYAVAVSVDGQGVGTAEVTEVLHGADRIRREPRDLGVATLTAILAPVERAKPAPSIRGGRR